MGAKSAKQYRLMAGIKAGTIKATGGLDYKTAAEFVDKTPKSKRSMFMKKKR